MVPRAWLESQLTRVASSHSLALAPRSFRLLVSQSWSVGVGFTARSVAVACAWHVGRACLFSLVACNKMTRSRSNNARTSTIVDVRFPIRRPTL